MYLFVRLKRTGGSLFEDFNDHGVSGADLFAFGDVAEAAIEPEAAKLVVAGLAAQHGPGSHLRFVRTCDIHREGERVEPQ